MVRLEVLSGVRKGASAACSRFPMAVGRSSDKHLSLEDPGVWPAHFSIQRRKNDLVLRAEPEALVTINGECVREAVLRNGDIICIGSARLQFGFTPVRQASLAWRERLTWTALAALLLGEVAIACSLS